MAQSGECPTLDFSSGRDPRAVGSSLALGSALNIEPAWDSLSLSLSLSLFLSLPNENEGAVLCFLGIVLHDRLLHKEALEESLRHLCLSPTVASESYLPRLPRRTP